MSLDYQTLAAMRETSVAKLQHLMATALDAKDYKLALNALSELRLTTKYNELPPDTEQIVKQAMDKELQGWLNQQNQ